MAHKSFSRRTELTLAVSLLLHAGALLALSLFEQRSESRRQSVRSMGVVELLPESKRHAVVRHRIHARNQAQDHVPVHAIVASKDLEPQSGGVQASSVPSTESSSALSPEQLYLADVRRLLEGKKSYPLAARRLGHQGKVVVRFVVGRDGRILQAAITEASPSDILNRAARTLIENLSELKPFPSEIRLAEWAVVVPIEYQM